MNRKNNAFTLVELLVVIAIISILAGMLMPALENAIGAAQTVQNIANIRQIQYALFNYAEDNAAYLPYGNGSKNNSWPMWSGKLVGMEYISDPLIFWGPRRNTDWFGKGIYDDLETMKVNASANSYQYSGYAVNKTLMPKGKFDVGDPMPETYRLGSSLKVHPDAVNQNPSPSNILLITEAYYTAAFYSDLKVDGNSGTGHSSADFYPLVTYNGFSAQGYLDGHSKSSDSEDIGWAAIDDRSGYWLPASHNHWARQEPWFKPD